MAQATRVRRKTSAKNKTKSQDLHGVKEVALIGFGTISIYLLVSLLTYEPVDPGWSHSTGNASQIQNLGGRAGAWFADFFLYVFGYLSYVFPILIGYAGWMFYRGIKTAEGIFNRPELLRFSGFVMILCGGTGLAGLHFSGITTTLPLDAGGILGNVLGQSLVSVFNALGSTLFLLALFLIGVTLFTNLSWFRLMDIIGRWILSTIAWLKEASYRLHDYWEGRRVRLKREQVVKVEKKKVKKRSSLRIEPVIKQIQVSDRFEKERQVPLFEPATPTELPPISLLDDAEPRKNQVSNDALNAVARQLELKLKDFGIEAEVVEVHPGPIITRFELQPAAGIKVSQITNLSKDLARSLSVTSVRVVEIIPGKNTIGLEVPNEHREMVRLGEIIKSKEFENAGSKLTLALGKDISGNPMVTDLQKMPHLLVAGTTGSGKSVALNAMVLSLLYNATPKEVRLIMIDPKMLELSVYDGIPHLLTPVVTDMKEAANALRWCVAEMDRRYQIMATLGVRNFAGYARKVEDAEKARKPILDPTYKPISEDDEPRYLQQLPYIVVVVDELADMMMLVGKKVEELIARIAQKARASGIHLILATQRPSVDVLTGLIKANIPTRIAFQVSSKIDSRTILDQMGAEQLLGHGDMLYLVPGTGVPTRLHGAFISDQEVHRVVQTLKYNAAPDYIEEIINGSADNESDGSMNSGSTGSEDDPLYDQAVRIVTESRRASISGVQRRLKVGYNRAARMIEEMERVGVVGPMQSNGAREVLVQPPPQ